MDVGVVDDRKHVLSARRRKPRCLACCSERQALNRGSCLLKTAFHGFTHMFSVLLYAWAAFSTPASKAAGIVAAKFFPVPGHLSPSRCNALLQCFHVGLPLGFNSSGLGQLKECCARALFRAFSQRSPRMGGGIVHSRAASIAKGGAQSPLLVTVASKRP